VLIHRQEDGTWATKNIAEIGANIPVRHQHRPRRQPNLRHSSASGTLRVYDVTNPFEGKLIDR